MAHPDLRNELFGALAREREEIVAAEQLRDLLDVAGPGALAAVETQVRRIGRPAALAYAEWLGRSCLSLARCCGGSGRHGVGLRANAR